MPYKDPEKRREHARKKKAENPEYHERLKKYWREYSKRNRPAINATKSKWRELRRLCRTPEELKEVRRKYRRDYYAHKSKNPEYNRKHGQYIKGYRAKLREKILQAYGAVCACCGESNPQFLTPDHINGGGSKHLKKRSTVGVYSDIIREGFPKDKYRILCMNCNWGRSVYGVCPHVSANKL